MKILILGEGYVGQALHKHLRSVVDCSVKSRRKLDYTDTHTLGDHLVTGRYDVCINACGYTGSPNVDACESNKDEAWYYNVTLPMQLTHTCMRYNTEFINISSGCIYTGYEKKFDENDEPNFGLYSTDSSWYSKTKHANELNLVKYPVYNLRVRMPFCDQQLPKNILFKLLKYRSIIDKLNSVTSIPDFCVFVEKFVERIDKLKYGIYNVVNPQPVTTLYMKRAMVHALGTDDKEIQIISEDELYTNTAAKRSNCVLSDEKIADLGLRLPETEYSLSKCIDKITTM